jgi:hypothetical protein
MSGAHPDQGGDVALTEIIPPLIVFDADYPYRTSLDHMNGLDAQLVAIARGNALLPAGKSASRSI